MSVWRDILGKARERIWTTFGPVVGATATTIGEALGSDINAGANAPTSNLVMVYACVRARRDAIGGVQFRAERPGKTGATVVETGPLAELLERPNRDMLWGEYVRTIETHLTLYDVAAVYVDADGRRPIALVPLHPAGLTVEHSVYAPTGTATVTAWRYCDPVTGEQRRFDREQVVIHRGYNPDAPLAALTATTPLRRTILNDNGIREANLALLKNGSVPSFMLSAPGLSTREQARELQQAWQEQNSGVKKRHSVSVTWGQAKAEKLGLTPQEMEFLAGLAALRQDYYRVFRVAPAMTFDLIGETGLSQGSATDEQIRMWWEMVGTGELEVIEGLHNEILHRWPGLTNGASIVADSGSLPVFVRARQAKVKDLQTLVTLGWRPDDASEYLDLDLPAHADNIARVPFSMQTIGEAEDAPGSATLAGGAAEGIQDKALNGAQVASLNAIVQSVASGMLPAEAAVLMITGAFPTIPEADAKAMIAAAAAFDPETPAPAATQSGAAPRGALAALAGLERAIAARADAGRKALDALRAALVRNEARRWSRFWVEQRTRVLAAVAKLPKREAGDGRRRDETEEMLKRIFDATGENAALAARLTPLWQQEFEAGWNHANQELAVKAADNPFQIDDPRIKTAIDRWTVKGQMANDTTAGAIRDILKQGFEDGLTNADLGDRIADYYAANCVGEKSARPQVAARTQVNGIVNESRLLAAEEIGGVLKVWNHGAPDEPRQAHLDAATAYAGGIALEEKFKVGVYECDAPGDPTLPADETCNCTCYLTFVKTEDQ